MGPLLIATAFAMAFAQSETHEISFQGCVTPGLDRGTYVVTQVTDVAGPQNAQIPEMAHGRRVLFWLDNDAAVRTNIGRKVAITGTYTGIEESEIELKAGPHQTGGFIVEFEGPGRDVRTADPSVSTAVGTAGRVTTEKNDLKTYLLRIDVTNVRTIEGSCSADR